MLRYKDIRVHTGKKAQLGQGQGRGTGQGWLTGEGGGLLRLLKRRELTN